MNLKESLQSFFEKKYSKSVALDYLKRGKTSNHQSGVDLILENKTYHFDHNLNLKGTTIW